MNRDFLSPILLAVEPFILGAGSASAALNPTQLINPNRTAMLVDEFRFNVALTEVGTAFREFASTQVKLSLGAIPLTNDFIPLRSFAPTYFRYPDDQTLVWHLPRPMYVPPDVQINVEFKRKIPWAGTSVSATAPWGFSIAGRSMPAGMVLPHTIFVPWACATSIYTEELPFISGTSDIGNPFNDVMHVDYFTGFNMTSGTTTLKPPLTVQMTLSNGKVICRDPTPFFILFPADRPILRAAATLQPKEFVSVVVEVPQPILAPDDSALFTTIGMTGWRAVNRPQGALP